MVLFTEDLFSLHSMGAGMAGLLRCIAWDRAVLCRYFRSGKMTMAANIPIDCCGNSDSR